MDLIEVEATAMAAGGDAIARQADGRVVFVTGALPGERVRVGLHTVKKDFAKGAVIDVLDPSVDRVAPPCVAHAAGCGGCPWQHVSRDAQRLLKRDIVLDALQRIGRFEAGEVTVRMAEGSSEMARTSVRVGVDGSGRPGHRRNQAHDVIPTDECRAAHPRLAELLVGGYFPGASEVVLRVGLAGGERVAMPDVLDGVAGVPADVIVGDHGKIHEVVAGARFEISMDSFFQAGPASAEALVAAVTDAVGDALVPGGHLVDAYAGVGLFAATVGAARSARVTAIESGSSAAADARINLSGIEAEVRQEEVGRWKARGPRPDVVVADPARPGLGRPGVAALVAASPARLVLVSCDPASLARDARLLAEAGYHPVITTLVDAFPDTFHVEAVTRFDPR